MTVFLFNEQVVQTIKKYSLNIAGIISTVALWTLMSRLFTPVVVPYPWDVAQHIIETLFNKETLLNLLKTWLRAMGGLTAGLLAGTSTGIIMGLSKTFHRTFFVPLVLLQSASPLLWVVPLILILGVGQLAPIAIVFLVVLPLVILNVTEGIRTIPDEMNDMFKVYAPGWQMRLKHLLLPAISAAIRSSTILASMLALKAALIGEWFGAHDGIGRVVSEYFYSFDMKSFYGVSLLYLIMVTLTAAFVNRLLRRVFKRATHSYSHDHIPDPGTSLNTRTSKKYGFTEATFAYNRQTSILEKASLVLEPAKVYLLTGASGSGKTTIARFFCNLISLDSGKLYAPIKPALVFQQDLFCNHIDCVTNTALPLLNKKIPFQQAQYQAIQLLSRFGLQRNLSSYPDQLSVGMKKRLALARAFALNPDLLILDEPFSNLDEAARDSLWADVINISKENSLTVLVITHYPEDFINSTDFHYQLKNKKTLIISADVQAG